MILPLFRLAFIKKQIHKMPTNTFYKKFRFVKPFKIGPDETKVGDELVVMENNIYFNNHMPTPGYYRIFHDLITDEIRNGFNYLKDYTDYESMKSVPKNF